MKIREINPDLAKLAKDELGEDPKRIQEDLDTIRLWLSKQPHIKARTDDQWLVAFLRGCKYSLERTKEKLDNFYTMRTMIPEVNVGIDPMLPNLQTVLKLGIWVPIPKTITPDGQRIIIIRPGLYDPSTMAPEEDMKLSRMFTDIMLMEDDNTVIAGQRIIMDFTGISMRHLVNMTPTNVKKMVKSRQEAVPIRQKGVHHMNTYPGFETLFNLFQSFMSEKQKSRIYVHNKDMEALYKFVPKSVLPTEYGGDAGPIQAMIDDWKKKVESYRAWFVEDVQYKTDESRRPGKPKTFETEFGIEGSFRKLNVD